MSARRDASPGWLVYAMPGLPGGTYVSDDLGERFKDNNCVDLGPDKIAKQRLLEAAEKAKIELSSAKAYLPRRSPRPSGPPGRSGSWIATMPHLTGA